MEEINALIDLCKGSVNIAVNPHRDTYETMSMYLDSIGEYSNEADFQALLAEMMRRDRMVVVQVYDVSPVGFYLILHWDVETAITMALRAVRG